MFAALAENPEVVAVIGGSVGAAIAGYKLYWAQGKNVKSAPAAATNDAIMGEIRNMAQAVQLQSAAVIRMEQKLDGGISRMEQMHDDNRRDVDVIKRDLVTVVAKTG